MPALTDTYNCPECRYTLLADGCDDCPECGLIGALATAKRQAQQGDTFRPWLHRFAIALLIATFALIAIGGNVTSLDVGMAVPDGFTTFGHFTLFAPPKVWLYELGTRWEHSHRIQGNIVGIMSIVMAFWLIIVHSNWASFVTNYKSDGLISACLRFFIEGKRHLLRWTGLIMLILISFQGILGALRVSEISITLAFVHGICGQLILCAWVLVAAALSRPWINRLIAMRAKPASTTSPWLRRFAILMLVFLLTQLTLGAAVRHFKADKSPPDFPQHFGRVIPPMTQDALDEAYIEYHGDLAGMTEAQAEANIANRSPQGEIVVPVGKVHLQVAHRLGAYTVFTLGIVFVIWVLRKVEDKTMVWVPAMAFLGLLVLQVSLGILTVLTETSAIAATGHQATGAVLLSVAVWLTVRLHLAGYSASTAVDARLNVARPDPLNHIAYPPTPQLTNAPA